MHAGVRRLFLVHVHKEMEFLLKTMPGDAAPGDAYAPLGRPERLRHELATFIADRAFLSDGAEIRTEQEFRRRLDPGWCAQRRAHKAATDLETILKEHQPLAADLIGTEDGLTRHPMAWPSR